MNKVENIFIVDISDTDWKIIKNLHTLRLDREKSEGYV